MVDWGQMKSKLVLALNKAWETCVRLHTSSRVRFGWPLVVTTELLALVAFVFALFPGLDLIAADTYFQNGHFIGRDGLGPTLRVLGWLIPFTILTLATIGWGLRMASTRWPAHFQTFPILNRPDLLKWFTHLQVLYLVLTMALGPGLLVNVTLKDHWHRPRPVQVQDFGGPMVFRAWWHTDGACQTNCSFVSGEASSAMWLLAPALLVPQPFQPLAVAGALMFGISVGRLRMAFGGHFLSDTLFSMLLTILVVLLLQRWLKLEATRPPDGPKPSI